VWTRLNERYRGAVFLSQLVVKSSHLERTDKFRAFGACFLVDMNRVFENVLGFSLKRHIEEDYGSKVLLLYSAKAPINVNGRTREIGLSGIRRLAKAAGS